MFQTTKQIKPFPAAAGMYPTILDIQKCHQEWQKYKWMQLTTNKDSLGKELQYVTTWLPLARLAFPDRAIAELPPRGKKRSSAGSAVGVKVSTMPQAKNDQRDGISYAHRFVYSFMLASPQDPPKKCSSQEMHTSIEYAVTLIMHINFGRP